MKIPLIAFIGIVTTQIFGQITLIDNSSGNGDFESGVLSPWFGDFSVAENPAFANRGSWFAVLQNPANNFPSLIQNLAADRSKGLTFELTFAARIASPGFDSVSVRMFARTSGGAPLTAIVTPIVVPSIVDSAWQNYKYRLGFSEGWNTSGINFSIFFLSGEPPSGNYSAYLDNIILQQIPEPSSLILLGMGGSFLFSRLARKSRSNALRQA